MSALVLRFPGAATAAVQPSPTMSELEVVELSGGYVQPVRQLRELHARGFTRAYQSRLTGRVVLERAHHDAVVRGQFGEAQAPAAAAKPLPDRAGLRAHFRQKRKKS